MPPTAEKHPMSSMPEPAPEGTAIVVIHPGSSFLRIGRASDTYPQTIPHCIARRHKHPGKQKRYEDPWLMRPECMHSEAKQQLKIGLKLAEEAIRYRPTTSGEYRQPVSYKQLAPFNSQIRPEKTDIPSGVSWTNVQSKPEVLTGNEALYVNPAEPYNVHWPITRGHFNLHPGTGGSPSAVLSDLEVIWGVALSSYLEIPLKDLKHYRAVLLIPDIYNRSHVKDLMSLLLNNLGFGAAFCHQESVCATFGSGVPSACVVDMGDQKASVCCVEDGLSQRNTRFCMQIGGSDVTRVFHWLLTRAGFPYRTCDLKARSDALFMQGLKEEFCHMDQDVAGAKEQRILVRSPNGNVLKFPMQVGDEPLLAAMAAFYPDMLGLQGAHLCQVHSKSAGDAEDVHDENYLRQTQSRQEQAARLVAARKKNAAAVPETGDGGGEDDPGMMGDEDSNDQPESLPTTDPQTGLTNPKKIKMEVEEEDTFDPKQGILGIDQAILQSIEKCDSEEMKRRMYSCIVIVGGGLMFPSAESWIKYAIWTQMPPAMRVTLETMDVFTQPKEMDPRLTCWKGGAILSCLDTAQELWIRQREWKRLGVRVLRERAPFIW